MSEKKKATWLSIMNLSDLNREFCNAISKRNLTLAGVSLTALSLMIGFYKDNLSAASMLLQTLLFSMLIFFLGSQIGFEAERLWHILLSDLAQYVGTIILMLSFSWFISQKLEGNLYVIFIIGALFSIVYLIKGVRNLFVLTRNMQKGRDACE